MVQPQSPPTPRGQRFVLFAVLASLLALLATAMVGEGVLRLAGYSPANVNPLKAFHEFDPVLGWRGRKLAWYALIALIVMIVSYWGIPFGVETFHTGFRIEH